MCIRDRVIRIKENQDDNITSIFLSDESVAKSKELETEDLKIGCYLENLDVPVENPELIEVETLNTRDDKKFNYGIKVESSLNIDPECIKKLLDLILNHEKGWINELIKLSIIQTLKTVISSIYLLLLKLLTNFVTPCKQMGYIHVEMKEK